MNVKRLILVSTWALLGLWNTVNADPRPGLKFIRNKSQWPCEVDFKINIPGGNLSLQAGLLTYSFLDQRMLENLHEQAHSKFNEVNHQAILNQTVRGQIIQASFLGSNPNSIPQPFGKSAEYYNYFLGNDTTKWSSDVSSYEGTIYPDFYTGIDLKIHSQGQNLKYDFIVSPGSDISSIRFEYKGAENIYLENGDLIVHTTLVKIIEKKPHIYQIINGRKVTIEGSFQVVASQISFCLEEPYDPCFELVIDPLLIFSTYSGFSADNWGSSATPGEHGTLYSAGVTNLFNVGGTFPATPGAFQTSYGGLYDVAVYKYDSTGQQLLYASFLGGGQSESPHSLVMTANEELLVLGTTSSLNFPTSVNAFDKNFNGGVPEGNVIGYNLGADIFIAKISKEGNQLLGSTYLGGTQNDGLNPTISPLVRNYGDQLRGDIISDSGGNIFVSTVTSSADFPVVNGFDLSYNGGSTDALIMKLTNDLSQVLWASFLGGSQVDASHTIQVDKNGDLFIGGGTTSLDFPTLAGAYQTTHAGNADGWISKMAGDGSSILNSTFTGTALFNQVYFLDLDQQENVYVYGQTEGAFPITANVYKTANSGQFLQKFDNTLSSLVFSTVFGSGIGIPNISPTAFLVNDCNNIYLSGWGGIVNSAEGFWQSNTNGMAVTADAFQSTTSGSDFYLMVLSGDATQLLYATYLGGTTSRTHLDGGTCRFDKSGVVYHAVCAGCAAFNGNGNSPSSDFPTSADAWSKFNGSGNCNNAAFKFDLASLRARIQTNSVALDKPGLMKVCLPDKIVFQNRSVGGETFFWDFGDNNQLTKQDRTDIIYQYTIPGTYIVKLKAVDLGTCIGKDSTKATISVYSPLGSVGPDLVMCFDKGTQLMATGGTIYQWKAAGNTFLSTQANPTVNPQADASYFVTVTDANGCLKKDTVNVRVVPGIDLKFTMERINYDCFNRPALRVTNQTSSAEEVFFDFGDGTTSDLPGTVHNYSKDGLFSVRLIGKKEACVYDKEIKVPIFELKVPNVFTPEQSSGFNDFFEIEYGGKSIVLSGINVSIVILNRWGGKVFENKNYKNDWTAFDQPAGTYYYETKIEGETTCKGWVQVVK